jgi:hypothetical protein
MSKLDTYDQTLKILARNHADAFLRLTFPDTSLHLVGTVENVELILPKRPVDFLHRVEYAGQDYLFHLEFQLEHESDFPQRMFSYVGIMTEQFDLPVLAIAIYLRPRVAPLPNAYVVTLDDQPVNRFTYPVIKLWEHKEAIRSGQYRELAPLLVMLVKDPTEQLLQEERALILQEPDPQKRADLLALAVAIAEKYYPPGFLWEFFSEEVNQMKESFFVKQWMQESLEEGLEQGIQKGLEQGIQKGLEQGIQKGLEQGIQKGEAQGLEQGKQTQQRTDILDILAQRFNPPAIRTLRIIRHLEAITDSERLRDLLLYAALHATDIADFEQRLASPEAERADA